MPAPAAPDCVDCHVCAAHFGGPDGEAAFGRIMAQGVRQTYLDGQTLFLEGQAASQVFFVCAGASRVTRVLLDGSEFLLDVVTAGGLLGWEGLDGREHDATATVTGELTCCVVPTDALRGMLPASPALAMALLRVVHASRDAWRSRYLDVAASHAPHRIARFLVNTLPLWRANMPQFTQLDIAQAVGLTPETVSRVLSQFRRKRWILGRSRTLTVVDVAALQRLAGDTVGGFDPGADRHRGLP